MVKVGFFIDASGRPSSGGGDDEPLRSERYVARMIKVGKIRPEWLLSAADTKDRIGKGSGDRLSAYARIWVPGIPKCPSIRASSCLAVGRLTDPIVENQRAQEQKCRSVLVPEGPNFRMRGSPSIACPSEGPSVENREASKAMKVHAHFAF